MALGVVCLLAGIVALSRIVESLYVLGIFLSVDLVVMGMGWISIGLGLKSRVWRPRTDASLF
ncbi:MAG: hypothetical protein ACXWLB_07415 [Reyranella sp.]